VLQQVSALATATRKVAGRATEALGTLVPKGEVSTIFSKLPLESLRGMSLKVAEEVGIRASNLIDLDVKLGLAGEEKKKEFFAKLATEAGKSAGVPVASDKAAKVGNIIFKNLVSKLKVSEFKRALNSELYNKPASEATREDFKKLNSLLDKVMSEVGEKKLDSFYKRYLSDAQFAGRVNRALESAVASDPELSKHLGNAVQSEPEKVVSALVTLKAVGSHPTIVDWAKGLLASEGESFVAASGMVVSDALAAEARIVLSQVGISSKVEEPHSGLTKAIHSILSKSQQDQLQDQFNVTSPQQAPGVSQQQQSQQAG